MPYTVTQLINEAYYTSGIVSRGFETVTGTQLNDGLLYLNEILSMKTADNGMIPYETSYTFNADTGEGVYFVPNLIAIDTLAFNLQSVRYSMGYTPRNQYFGSSRVEGINSLPFEWYFERTFRGGNIHIYFSPDQDYPMHVHGIFRLGQVTLNQDLTTNKVVCNLGIPTVSGTGQLGAGVFVLNGVDLAGTYATITDLVTYINTGVVPNVTAQYVQNEFILFNTAYNGTITVSGNGNGGSVNNISFYFFDTADGEVKSQPFFGLALDRFYITYLKFALADYICTQFNQAVPPGVAQQLANCEAEIDKSSRPLDMRLNKVSTLQKGTGLNWAWVNLGRGFTVPY